LNIRFGFITIIIIIITIITLYRNSKPSNTRSEHPLRRLSTRYSTSLYAMHTAPTHINRAVGAVDSRRWPVDRTRHGEPFYSFLSFLMAVIVQTAALFIVTRCFLGSPEERAGCVFRIDFHGE
jgi:hypothetical protein